MIFFEETYSSKPNRSADALILAKAFLICRVLSLTYSVYFSECLNLFNLLNRCSLSNNKSSKIKNTRIAAVIPIKMPTIVMKLLSYLVEQLPHC